MASSKTLDPASADYNISFHSMPNVPRSKETIHSQPRAVHRGGSDNTRGEGFYEVSLSVMPRVDSAPVHKERKGKNPLVCKSDSFIVLLHLPSSSVPTCVEKLASSFDASNEFNQGGQSELCSFHTHSFNAKDRSMERSQSSNLSSTLSSDPCGDLEGGPRVPPNPTNNAPLKKKLRLNVLQDPFSRQMLDRYHSYRPTGSQHNSEAPLDFQHPFQTVAEPEPWTKRMRSWFVTPADPVTPVQIWPPPITLGVNNNQSSSSFLLRSQELPITMEENVEPSYTPQGIPLGADKQFSSIDGNHGTFLCCWPA